MSMVATSLSDLIILSDSNSYVVRRLSCCKGTTGMNQLSPESGGTYHLATAVMHRRVCRQGPANHVSSDLVLEVLSSRRVPFKDER